MVQSHKRSPGFPKLAKTTRADKKKMSALAASDKFSPKRFGIAFGSGEKLNKAEKAHDKKELRKMVKSKRSK